jgi:hypothetical protein
MRLDYRHIPAGGEPTARAVDIIGVDDTGGG